MADWMQSLHDIVLANPQAIGGAAGALGAGKGFGAGGQAFAQGQAFDQQRALQQQQAAQKQAMQDQQNAARQGILQGGGGWVQGLPQQQLDYLGANPALFDQMMAQNMQNQLTPPTPPKPLRDASGRLRNADGSFVFEDMGGYVDPKSMEGQIALAGSTEQARLETKSKFEAKDALGKYEDDAVSAINLIDGMIGNESKGIKQHKGLGGAVGGWFDASKPDFLSSQDTVDFRAMQAQLQGKVFVKGIGALKGLGAMSELEGKKTADAIARLESAQSEPAYIEALDEVRGMFNKALKRAREKAGITTDTGNSKTIDMGNGITITPM